MGTNVSSVTCNHCGAPLEVPETTRFITCVHCGSRLEVHRDGNAIYTDVLGSIDQRTRDIADDVDVIRRQNEVERLDREWMMNRDQYMVQDKYGRRSAPSAVGGVITCIAAVVFGIFWIGVTASSNAPAIFPLFGVIFIIVGLIAGVGSIARSGQLDQAEADYHRQRAELMRPDQPQPAEPVRDDLPPL